MAALLVRLRAALPRQLSPLVLGPATLAPSLLLQRCSPPTTPSPSLAAAAVPDGLLDRPPPLPAAMPWLEGLLLMAVPKKKISYTRKRVRPAGHRKIRGPFLKAHMSICPVCERMREPHRVCGREDCQTYWRHRWF